MDTTTRDDTPCKILNSYCDVNTGGKCDATSDYVVSKDYTKHLHPNPPIVMNSSKRCYQILECFDLFQIHTSFLKYSMLHFRKKYIDEDGSWNHIKTHSHNATRWNELFRVVTFTIPSYIVYNRIRVLLICGNPPLPGWSKHFDMMDDTCCQRPTTRYSTMIDKRMLRVHKDESANYQYSVSYL